MTRRKPTIGIALLVLAAVVTVTPGLWFHAQQRQHERNRELIDALVHRDGKKALAMVNEGADPNAYWTPSIADNLKRIAQGRRPIPPGAQSAFLIACTNGGTRELLQAMLQHGADVNAKDEYGMTPLLWVEPYPDIVALLRQYGAK